MPITPADLQNTVFKTGQFHGVGGTRLQTPTVPPVPFNDQEQEHFVAVNARVKYNIVADPVQPGVKRINFAPPTGHNDAFYLPYRDNNISSVVIDNTANRFFTDTLSGCTVYIDQHPNGTSLIVYHANVQGGHFRPSPEQAGDCLYEKQLAIAVKEQLRTNAANAIYAGAQPLGSLYKRRYNQGMENYQMYFHWQGQKNVQVGGGTTVVGFRTEAGWEFWYQTWGGEDPRVDRVLGCEKFYP